MILLSKASKIIPLFNNVLIKKLHRLPKSKGGILYGKEQKSPLTGIVVAMGKDCKKDGLKVGDKVYLTTNYNGRQLHVEGFKEQLFMYRDHDMLGVIDEKVEQQNQKSSKKNLENCVKLSGN